jgi:hypothetical protein
LRYFLKQAFCTWVKILLFWSILTNSEIALRDKIEERILLLQNILQFWCFELILSWTVFILDNLSLNVEYKNLHLFSVDALLDFYFFRTETVCNENIFSIAPGCIVFIFIWEHDRVNGRTTNQPTKMVFVKHAKIIILNLLTIFEYLKRLNLEIIWTVFTINRYDCQEVEFLIRNHVPKTSKKLIQK